MSVADKIVLLQQAKAAIRQAIISKSVSVSESHGFSSFDDDIALIGSGTNATASDIIRDKVAFVGNSNVTGTLDVNDYYTGSGTPSGSLGVNGDIYLQIN